MSTIIILLPLMGLFSPDSPAGKTIFRPEMFQTLVNPNCSHCIDESKRKAGSLRDDDRVLCWIRGKYDGGAIPYRWFLVPYRVISDTYGVFVYDADADFVRGYPASLDYRFQGWRDGVMVMKHADGTLFDCLSGRAFDGPRKGEKLKPIPTLESDWGPWLKAGPGTVAYAMVSKFQPQNAPNSISSESKASRGKLDPRLEADDRVFGVEIGDKATALPLKSFGKEPELRPLGGALVFWDPRTRTAVAYEPKTESSSSRSSLTFSVDASQPEAPWIDKETGSRWGITGRAVAGPLKGESLVWVPGVMVKWFAWSASYPETKVADVK